MARVLKRYNVEVFILELPPGQGERVFHGLLAWCSADAVAGAMRRVFARRGAILNKNPKRMVIAVDCYGEIPNGQNGDRAGKKG